MQAATTLPPAAVRLLQFAAAVAPTKADPLARVKAIEAATEQVRRRWPQFFKEQSK